MFGVMKFIVGGLIELQFTLLWFGFAFGVKHNHCKVLPLALFMVPLICNSFEMPKLP